MISPSRPRKAASLINFLAIGSLLVCGAATAAAPEPAPVLQKWTEPLTGIEFIALPKGCLQMGTAKPIEPPFDSNWARMGYKGNLAEDEVPKHEVCVDAFWMAKTEISEADWHKVMGGDAPASTSKVAKVNVTWLQAQEFVKKLSAHSIDKQRFRLPTEAEWEYACRAGAKVDDEPDRGLLATKAWYRHSPQRSYEVREVGMLQANAFGLHDMLGNAWEWTQDNYLADGYARHSLYDPKVEVQGNPRVIRGASFRTELAQMRCAMRGRYDPDQTMDSIGLRLVRQP